MNRHFFFLRVNFNEPCDPAAEVAKIKGALASSQVCVRATCCVRACVRACERDQHLTSCISDHLKICVAVPTNDKGGSVGHVETILGSGNYLLLFIDLQMKLHVV